GGRDDASVGIQVDERRARVIQPPTRLERYIARMTNNDEPTQLRRSAVIAASLPLATDAVMNDQVALVDGDRYPIAAQKANAVAGRLGSLSLHTKLNFRVPCP